MFTAPSVRTFTSPADQIEEMTRYVLTLVSFEDTGISQFEKDKAKPGAEHSILWKWYVHDNDHGAPIYDGDQAWEFWDWTSNRTGSRTDGSPSKARARLQAVIGRELTDEEIAKFIGEQTNMDKLPGRRAYATFTKSRVQGREGDLITKLKIQAIMPFNPKAPTPSIAPGVTMTAAAPAAVIQPTAPIPFDPPTPVDPDAPLL